MNYGSLLKYVRGRFPTVYSSVSYYSEINTWLNWYKGYVKEFHTTKCSNGLTVPTREIYKLNMGKRVCEDWASSVLNEDVNIVVNTSSGNKSSVYIQGSKGETGVLGSNNFRTILSSCLEQMFALGTSAFTLDISGILTNENGDVISISKDAKISIKNHNATQIIPISWQNGTIFECAFISSITYDNNTYYIINSHVREFGEYVIYNEIIDNNYRKVSLDKLNTHSKKPLFYILKTNISNNIDLDSPLGLSIYANAIDNLKCCDIAYDSCMREVITGQRIIMMNKCLLTTDDQGKPIAPQDTKQMYMQFFGDDAISDVNEFFKEFHPTLNTDSLDKELQNQLNMLSDKVGLGVNYYKFDGTSVNTATEYIGQRNDFIRNANKISLSLIDNIREIVLGILYIGKNILNANVDDNAKVVVTISDGVVEDDAKKRESDRQDVQDGIMSKAEYRAKWYGETIEEAQKKIDEIISSNSSEKSL